MSNNNIFNNIDLHSHSLFSDGVLSPSDVAKRAKSHHVTMWALSDHDCVDGLAQAQQAAENFAIGKFVPGVEISIEWNDVAIHIVGLNIDYQNETLKNGVKSIRDGRFARAERMSKELEKVGIHGVLDGALKLCKNPNQISRAHFARFMVSQGVAKTTSQIFENYLVPGKPGYVDHKWASLEDSINWIHNAGGLAVLAHPGRYKVSGTAILRLCADFKDLGGDAIEAGSGSHSNEQIRSYTTLANYLGLAVSCGSDFHSPKESKVDIGNAPKIPPELKHQGIWEKLL